jgi:ribosomal protein S18 acetylase RimI-like enzyme
VNDALDVSLRVTRPEEIDVLAAMVVGLYAEDPGTVSMTPERARRQAAQMVSLAAAEPVPVRPLLARRGDEVVGYAILAYFWSNELGGRLAYLDEIFVRPDRRGRGIGSSVVRHAIDLARSEGLPRILLEVNDTNPRARRLYSHLGFVALSRRTMALSLESADPSIDR